MALSVCGRRRGGGGGVLVLVLVTVAILVTMTVTVTAAAVSRSRSVETIVGRLVSGGPVGPVMRLTVPADRSTLLSTVQSVMSFGGGGTVPRPPPTDRPELITATSLETSDLHSGSTGRPKLVTASVPETALDLSQTPTISSSAAFNHSTAAHTFFGPEDAVTTRPVAARRAKDEPQSRRDDGPQSRHSDGPQSLHSDRPQSLSRRTDGPQYRLVDRLQSRHSSVGPQARLSDGPQSRHSDGPQYRRVVEPPPSSITRETVTPPARTITVAESLHCPQGNAFWPSTSQCVPIGKQGPCAEGNIIQLNVTDSEPVSCVCRAGHLAWTDGVCYLRFSPGPCGPGGVICESETGPAECRCRSGFHQGSDGRCHQEYTQADCPANSVFIHGECVAKGPCPEGFFMVFDQREQRYTCGCPEGFLLVAAVNRCIRARTACRHCVENLYRWPEDGHYYRELSRGPCNDTELLIQTSSGPECGCGKYSASDESVSRYLEPTVRWPLDGRCYRLYSRAICPAGHWFIWSSALNRMPVCCPEGHFFWPEDDKCYEEFTRGPCDKSQLFVNVLRTSVCTCDDQWGFTVLNPEDGTCYLRNTQGPCPTGFRFLGSKDGQKVCDCFPGEFYHEASKKCFPLYQQGPCPSGKWLEFSTALGRAECAPSPCPLLLTDGAPQSRVPRARLLDLPPPQTLVYWNVTDRCYQIGTQGPCSDDFRLELDEYGISPVCQPVHESNHEEPVPAPLDELSRCPPGSRRAVLGLCPPVLVTSVQADTESLCGPKQMWSSSRARCEPEEPPPTASCPASYHPYPEGGECVCPRRQYPDEDGTCRPSAHHGPGPLHWTIHNYQQHVMRHQQYQAAGRRLW